jgi:hypothetical protein
MSEDREMKTKFGNIELIPEDDGRELLIKLTSDNPIDLDTAIQLLNHLITEIKHQVDKLAETDSPDSNLH